MHAKDALRSELVTSLRAELAAAVQAHRTTAEAATHAEAKPENDKDTRALEQSYLARGQAARVEELLRAVAEVESMTWKSGDAHAVKRVALGALVTVDEGDEQLTYWIAAHGGGTRLSGGAVQVVTIKSPLGRALLGKIPGDDCDVVIGGKTRNLSIAAVD